MTHLSIDVHMLYNLIRKYCTENMRPVLCDKVQVCFVELNPGIVLGHVKLHPIRKDDALKLCFLFVQKCMVLYTTHYLNVMLSTC